MVIEYEDVRDYKGESDYHTLSLSTAFSDRLLAPGGSREDAFDISQGRLFLVEARRQSLEQNLVCYILEAVSQAIALLRSAKYANTSSFTSLSQNCFPAVQRSVSLSDEQTWIFFILQLANETLTYYESAIRRLSGDVPENSDLPLREIVQLVSEWVSFSICVHISFSWTTLFS